MMTSFQYFNFFLLFIVTTCYSQKKASVNFEYYNITLDEFDAFKYEKLKKSKIEIVRKFEIPLNIITIDSLAIRESIIIESNIGEICVFKFYDYKTLILKNGLEVNNLLKDDLIYVLSKLDLEVFLNFYSSKLDVKYSDINKFKNLVKDEKGDLDIQKLSNLLKQNKPEFSKYFD